MSDHQHEKPAAAPAVPTVENPLEALTSLVLDAADAANDSAQLTGDALRKLTHVVETNEEAAKSIRLAPAIFGAVTLAVGIVLAVLVAVVVSEITHRSESLVAAIATQEEQLAKVNESLKAMSRFEEVLQKYEKVADDTTQRAIVTLREQVKADRLAVQQLEVKRLNEVIAAARGNVVEAATAKPKAEDAARMASLEKSVARLDSRLDEVVKLLKDRPREAAAAAKPAPALSKEQAKDLRVAVEEVSNLKKEMSAMRQSLEDKSSRMQPGVPAYRKAN